MSTNPMTPKGLEKLKRELDTFKKVERGKNIKDIEEARAHGDLRENAEYDAAKNRQGFIEAKIRELEDKIARAQVIDPSRLSGEKVLFGATVTIYDTDNEQANTFCIVGEDESNIKEGKISVFSPIARALIGKCIGDEVIIKTPQKIINCEIQNVLFKEV